MEIALWSVRNAVNAHVFHFPSALGHQSVACLFVWNCCCTSEHAAEWRIQAETAWGFSAGRPSVFLLKSHTWTNTVSLNINTNRINCPARQGRAGVPQGKVKPPESRCSNTCRNKYNFVELEGMFLLIHYCWLCVCVCVCIRRPRFCPSSRSLSDDDGLPHSADLKEQEVEALQAVWEAAETVSWLTASQWVSSLLMTSCSLQYMSITRII